MWNRDSPVSVVSLQYSERREKTDWLWQDHSNYTPAFLLKKVIFPWTLCCRLSFRNFLGSKAAYRLHPSEQYWRLSIAIQNQHMFGGKGHLPEIHLRQRDWWTPAGWSPWDPPQGRGWRKSNRKNSIVRRHKDLLWKMQLALKTGGLSQTLQGKIKCRNRWKLRINMARGLRPTTDHYRKCILILGRCCGNPSILTGSRSYLQYL